MFESFFDRARVQAKKPKHFRNESLKEAALGNSESGTTGTVKWFWGQNDLESRRKIFAGFCRHFFSRWQQLQCSAGLCALLLLRSQPLQALNSSDLAAGLDEDVQFT